MAQMTQNNLLSALRKCPEKNLQCRWSEIGRIGLLGFKGATEGTYTKPALQPPSPRFSTIERAIQGLFFLLGRALGSEFSLSSSAIRLTYRPHFQLLKMFDRSMERYWSHIGFLSWSLEVMSSLSDCINPYLKATGTFKMQDALLYFSKLEGKGFDMALRDLKNAAKILVEFDMLLLSDIQDLTLAISQGLDQVIAAKPAKTVPDQIALSRMTQDLELLYLKIGRNLPASLSDLSEHAKGWSLNAQPLNTSGVYQANNLRNLLDKVLTAIKKVSELRDGK